MQWRGSDGCPYFAEMLNSFETAVHSNDISKTQFVCQIRNIAFPTKPAKALELKTHYFLQEANNDNVCEIQSTLILNNVVHTLPIGFRG